MTIPAPESKRALITGAAGFVGRVLSAYLADQGWDVMCCDRITLSGGNWTVCDIRCRDDVFRTIQWAGALTHVFHLAAVTFVPDSERDPTTTFEVNLQGTVRVTEAMRAYAPRARLVYIGSAEAYGRPGSLPLQETHPFRPANPYAIAKAAADSYCAYLHQANALNVIRMRPFNHTGAGQSDVFVLSSFARQVAQIEAGQRHGVLRVGNLDTKRDFTHVRDAVRAYELAALRGVSGEAYNMCSGRPVLIHDALNKLLALSTAHIRVEVDPARMRAADVPEMWGSHDRLTAHTGWRPEVPFETLLADLLAYWREHESRSASSVGR